MINQCFWSLLLLCVCRWK